MASKDTVTVQEGMSTPRNDNNLLEEEDTGSLGDHDVPPDESSATQEQPVSPTTDGTIVELNTTLSGCTKEHVKILLVGPTGCGKSSLINKLLGQDLATIDDTAGPCQQAYVKEYQLKFNNVTVHIYDTRGLGDPKVDSTKILREMSNELQEIDLLLVCHKLYDKVNDFTCESMKKIKAHLGTKVFDHMVIFLTQADEYIVHCKSHRQQKGPEDVNIEFQRRIDSVRSKFQQADSE